MRKITYAQAIYEATDQAMARDRRIFVIGEGVPDPKGIFGTTLGLQKKYGRNRVMDMPVSESGVTGACIGAALRGMRPLMTHQRVDFSIYSIDQIVNVAAKWYSMFGGIQSVPIVIRMIVGRGWGQGAQHSQSLQATYAHFPGLKVVMPVAPYDAKGMLLSALEDPNPVIFIEHRWLHMIAGEVPKRYYTEPLGKARVVQKGTDMTLVGSSYMVVECMKVADALREEGISVEVVDLRTISPLDEKTILSSVVKTGRLIVCDTGYSSYGVASEVIASVSKYAFSYLRDAPCSISLPDSPTPTSWKLAEYYYPTHIDVLREATLMMKVAKDKISAILSRERKSKEKIPSDVPDLRFKGPF